VESSARETERVRVGRERERQKKGAWLKHNLAKRNTKNVNENSRKFNNKNISIK